MKKAVISLLAMVAILLVGTAWAYGSSCAKTTVVVPYTADIIGSGHNLTSVRDEGDEVIITITNVRSAPIGIDTKGKDLEAANVVELYSGIMDVAGIKAPFTVAKVVNGTAMFRIPNTAIRAGVPVVDHIWGRVGNRALVHDPEDPWVVSGEPRLKTLAIGIVMYPDKPTVSLKSLGAGKLDQGKHPEL